MQRIIKTKGRYNFLQSEREAYRLRIYGGVIEQPSNQYFNYTFNEPQSFYGHVQLCSGDIVLETKNLKYDSELLFELYTPIQNVLALNQFCETISLLNRSAQEWTQYAALPFSLVSPALILFFQNQATQVLPPILERMLPDSIRLFLYGETVYGIDTRVVPLDFCTTSGSPAFVDSEDKTNPPSFPDAPSGSTTPSPPYQPTDPDTPPSGTPGGLGGSNYLPNQPYGLPTENYEITYVVDLPGGACNSLPSALSVGLSGCVNFPFTRTIAIQGTWISAGLVREPFNSSSDLDASLIVDLLQVSGAVDESRTCVGANATAPLPQIFIDSLNWTINNAQLLSFDVVTVP